MTSDFLFPWCTHSFRVAQLEFEEHLPYQRSIIECPTKFRNSGQGNNIRRKNYFVFEPLKIDLTMPFQFISLEKYLVLHFRHAQRFFPAAQIFNYED